jgi:hypothetical protein
MARIGAGAALVAGAMSLLGAAAASPASGATTTFSGNVNSTGLTLSLFGNKLVGADSAACVNGGLNANKDEQGNATICDGKGANYAAGAGDGTLLTTSGLHAEALATEANAGQSDVVGSEDHQNCSPVTSGGPQGSNGVFLNLGVACGWAAASQDASGNPSAEGHGDVAFLNVDLNGILSQLIGASPGPSNCTTQTNQLIGALGSGLCQVIAGLQPVLGAASPGLEQAIQDLNDVALKDFDNTAEITLGPADSKISTPGDGTVTEKASGALLKVGVLPLVGCKAGVDLATCAANEVLHLSDETQNPTAAPLISVKVTPATCSAARTAGGTWSSSASSALVDVELNIPGDNIPIVIGQNAGTSQTILGGTPLQTTIKILAASSAPLGNTAGCNADSVTVSALENPTFPGGSDNPGTGGAIFVSTGSSTLSAGNGTPPTSPAAGPTTTTTTTQAAQTTAAVVTNPTAVHTGEWWSGSMPLLVAIAALGGGLIGWPRIRRLAFVSRVLHRSGK